MIIESESIFTGNIGQMDIPLTLKQYQDGLKRCTEGKERIQDVFPQLNADEREFLMTGTTPEEWIELTKNIGGEE